MPDAGDGGIRGRVILRLPDPASVIGPEALEGVLGPIAEVGETPLATPGFSGSTHTRVHVRLRDGTARSLVLKRTRVAGDWLSARTGDREGREGRLLGEHSLAGVWEAFACPYLAWSARDGEVALLMDDLSPCLLPDVREPVTEEQERRLIGAVAAMHARFWDSPASLTPKRPGSTNLSLPDGSTENGLTRG